ncbi:M12 family metallopeptidase [Mucilaginibacter sp. AW1-3]
MKSIFRSLKLLILISAILSFSACNKELKNEQQTGSAKSDNLIGLSLVNGKQITLHLKNGSTVGLMEYNGKVIMGGDIILSPAQIAILYADTIGNKLKVQTTFTTDFARRWPNKIIYYTITNTINQAAINQAISHWQANTGMQFVVRTTQPNYVDFAGVPLPGASGDSQIGMIGGQQFIRLEDNCPVQTVIHEIGHTVGLFHEQSRADRDQYINVNWSNINPNFTYQYQTYLVQGYFGSEAGPYDFQSVMGYSSFYTVVAYPGDFTPQITALNGATFSQGTGLSAGDILGVQLLYQDLYLSYDSVDQVYEQSDFVDSRDQDITAYFFKDSAHTIPGLPRTLRFVVLKTHDEQGYGGITHTIVSQTPVTLSEGTTSYYLGTESQRMYYDQNMNLQQGAYYESIGLSQIH